MRINFLIVVLLFLVTSGCTLVAESYIADPILEQQSDLLDSTKLEDGKYIVDIEKLKEKIDSIDTLVTKNNANYKDSTGMYLRNSLINELIAISCNVCSEHQARILANVNSFNFGLGTATNILSGLGTVLTGETTKAALAAGAAFSSSTRSLINEEIYRKAFGSTILRAISSARERYYAKIESRMDSSLIAYPIQEAIRDVQEYHRRCSFYYGVMEISKSLQERKMTVSEIQNRMRVLEKLKKEEEKKEEEDRDDDLIESYKKEIKELILLLPNAPN